MRSVIAAAAAVALALAPVAAEEPLADGLYRVSRLGTRRVEVAPVQEGERLLIHDLRYFPPEAAAAEPQQLVVVGTAADVALDLAERPRSSPDAEGRITVAFRLAAEPAARLAELTAAHPRVRLALVVDGEIVTVLKASGAVTDGAIAIAGCRASAGEHLADQLRDNVVAP